MACRTVNSARSDSDSDSDWDDDDDFASKKITIKIKPIAQITTNKISASVDELRAAVGTWKSLTNINLVKPNSRRHHQSTVQLDFKLPVAFAIQEFLNGGSSKVNINQEIATNHDNRMQDCHANEIQSKIGNRTFLTGHLKMAVPPKLATMEPNSLERNLEFELMTSIAWDSFKLNEQFIKEKSILPTTSGSFGEGAEQHHNHSHQQSAVPNQQQQILQPLAANSFSKTFVINMLAVQAYVEQQYQKHPNKSYYLLPELLNYTIGSQDRPRHIEFSIDGRTSTGTRIILNNEQTRNNFKIVKQNYQVGTSVADIKEIQ